MGQLKAIIFDVDGTLADTERLGHRVAFNQAFTALELDWHWDEDLYGKLLRTTGGKERIKDYIKNYLPDFKTDNLGEFVGKVHAKKTECYVELTKSGKLPLRGGIRELINAAKTKEIKIGIATTTTWANIETLLESQLGAGSKDWFAIIAAGDIVEHKKPAPDIYDYALDKLRLTADECIALEDSRNGLLSATGAGIKTIITTNGYTKDEDFTEASLVVDKFGSASEPFKVSYGESYGHQSVSLELLERIFTG